MTDDALMTSVADWLVAVTPVLAANVQILPMFGMRDPNAHLTVQVVSRVGRIESPISVSTMTVRAHERCRLQVTGYGSDATQWLRTASLRWGDETAASETLRAAGPRPIQGASFAEDRGTDAVLYTSTEPRASTDLLCYVQSDVYSESVDVVNTITTTINGGTPFTQTEPSP